MTWRSNRSHRRRSLPKPLRVTCGRCRPPWSQPHRRLNERSEWGRGGGGRLLLSVQLNLNVTEELADIISEEAQKAGSTRRFIARLMKEAGYPVPQADLTPYMNVRRRKGVR